MIESFLEGFGEFFKDPQIWQMLGGFMALCCCVATLLVLIVFVSHIIGRIVDEK